MIKILACLLAIMLSTSAAAQVFTNIAADPATGIDYQRTPEAANAIAETLAESGEPFTVTSTTMATKISVWSTKERRITCSKTRAMAALRCWLIQAPRVLGAAIA